MASLSIIESTSAIRCCSEIASTSSSVEDVQDVLNDTMANNNTQYHTQMDTESPFPRRESVNISFRNLKYTINKVNFAKRRFGKLIVKVKNVGLHGVPTAKEEGRNVHYRMN